MQIAEALKLLQGLSMDYTEIVITLLGLLFAGEKGWKSYQGRSSNGQSVVTRKEHASLVDTVTGIDSKVESQGAVLTTVASDVKAITTALVNKALG